MLPLGYVPVRFPQPSDVNTLFVVHGRLVDHVVTRLRKEYAKKNGATEVRPFHGNEEDREVLQLWFDTERNGPNVLVSSPAIVKESLDLRTIRHLVTGTRASADMLYHLIGRLAHSRAMCNKNDRVLLTFQQFANSNLRATPFVALDHGQEFSESGFTWINGHVLISDRAFAGSDSLATARALAAALLGLPEDAFWRMRGLLPASVSVFRREERFSALIAWNDVGHLK